MLRRILALLAFALPAPALGQSFDDAFADLAGERQAAESAPLESLPPEPSPPEASSVELPAVEARPLEGSWALRLDGAIIFRFDLSEDDGTWSGVWSRPGSFASDGNNFGSLKGPTETHRSSAGREVGGWVELTFPDDRPGAVPDVFRFNLLAPDRAELLYAGTGLAPYALERVEEDALLGPWEPGRVYSRDGSRPGSTAPDAEVQGPPRGPAFEGR